LQQLFSIAKNITPMCGFLALAPNNLTWKNKYRIAFPLMGDRMQKVALAMVLVISSMSLGGCFVGKGKAPPPPPIVRKG
jgi:hypothetical protein